MAKVLVCMVGCLLVSTATRAEQRHPNQLDTAKAFRQCSLAQKVDPRTLTDAGKEAATWCVALAMAYQEGTDVDESGKPIPLNQALAAQYFRIGCNLTVAFGCVAMGQMVENGQITIAKGQDQRLVALAWYTKGCYTQDKTTSDVALSCGLAGGVAMTVGLEKKKGRAMGKWLKTGLDLNERACQLGNDVSCRELVKIEQALSAAK